VAVSVLPTKAFPETIGVAVLVKVPAVTTTVELVTVVGI